MKPRDKETVLDLDGYLDLGCVLIPQMNNLEVRVDYGTGTLIPKLIILELPHSSISLQVFAAARYEDHWPQLRDDIVNSLTAQGVEINVELGSFGTEIHSVMPTVDVSGASVIAPVRLLAVNGDRWYVRVVISGDGAITGERSREVDELISQLVIHRGQDAMSPGEALPIVLPAS